MKSILFVINTLGTAGAEKALIEFLNKFDSEEYKIDLEVILNQGELVEKIPSHVNLINKHFDSTEINGKKSKLHLFKNTVLTSLRRGAVIRTAPYILKESIKMLKNGGFRKDRIMWQTLAMGAMRSRTKYDLAIAFTEGAATYYVSRYVEAAKKASFVHIAYENAGYSRSLDNGCYDNIDKIFCVSREVLNNFLEIYPEHEIKTEIFHNIIDVNAIDEKSREQGGFDDDFDGIRILSVARLARQKTLEKAIECLAILKSEGINARWYVVGEGEERHFLEGEIKKRNLSNDFRLLGFKENPYIYIKHCDIFANVSNYEGKSIAIQEAQALAKTVVATHCSGNNEQIYEGLDGILCGHDPKDIAESIKWIINNPEAAAQMGEAGRNKIYRYSSQNNEFERINALLYDDTTQKEDLPLISIMVPFHNTEKYLKRCVDSITGQSYKNLEIILLNNASTDNSDNIAKELLTKDKRITLHYLEKPGLAGARNELLKLAKGDYLIFVDSDDEMEVDAVMRSFEIAQKTGSDMVCGSHVYRTENADKSRSMPQRVLKNKEAIHRFFLTEGKNFNHAWGKLYKRDVIEELSYPDGKNYEDIFILPKIIERCSKVVTVPNSVYVYYKNEQSISADTNAATHMDGLEGRLQNLDFYKDKYPELENEALGAANDFVLFLLGKIYSCGVKSNRQTLEKTNEIIRNLSIPKGKEYRIINIARKMYRIIPRTTCRLLGEYSKLKNH